MTYRQIYQFMNLLIRDKINILWMFILDRHGHTYEDSYLKGRDLFMITNA